MTENDSRLGPDFAKPATQVSARFANRQPLPNLMGESFRPAMRAMKMTVDAIPTDVLTTGQHRQTDSPVPRRIIADRHAFIAAPNDWADVKELRFLGFTRMEWIYSGAPRHYLGYNHVCPHPDLLIVSGMVEAVERWRREAASEYEGDHGPVPAFWAMPDLIAQWELMNPDIVTARAVQAAELELYEDEMHALRH